MRRLLFRGAGVFVLVASFVAGWLLLDYRQFLQTPLRVGEQGLTYVVSPGSSLRQIARGLAQRGALEHPQYLVWLGRWQGVDQSVQAGEYVVEPGTRPSELLDMLARGRVRLHALTIVEGWSFDQLMDAVSRHEALVHRLRDRSDEEIMAAIGHPQQHPEGRFYPETYHFPRGTQDVDFLRRAYQTMARRLADEWQGRAKDLPFDTPDEALILASIVEKETAVPEERARIAGVFVRRLEKGMRLQTDPTVIYGMGDDYDGNIRRSDLRRDTPYNTYTRGGLPPTPIAMPGGASIHAVMHPAPGEALYFVAKGDGSHHFSNTIDEHNQAVIKYQLNGNPESVATDSGS